MRQVPPFRRSAGFACLIAGVLGCQTPAAEPRPEPTPDSTPQAQVPAAPVDSSDVTVRDTLVHSIAGAGRTPPTTPATNRAASAQTDSAARDSVIPAPAPAPRRARRDWPEPPEPLPGALLPEHRIVAYYGNPLSKRMGILGELPPGEMLAQLAETAKLWAAADSTTRVRPALHLIATVAQGRPGADGKYRLRMTDSLIEQVAGWAEERGWLLFLDIQPGMSTVEAELPRLLPYLKRPYVHLALDPEFAMVGRGDGAKPGRKVGTLDAREINWAIDTVAKLVTAYNLPPKVLVVHRFLGQMITNAEDIRRDPRVQVVIDMDGFGSPGIKRSTWRAVILRDPVQYTGVKLFYKNDDPLMSPSQVLETFWPVPVYVQYQ